MANYDGVALDVRDEAEALIAAVARADAALDLDAFVALLAPAPVLRIGSQPELVGEAAIRAEIGGLFSAMRSGIQHSVARAWGDRYTLVYQAEALFSMKDGRDIVLPYVNVLDLGAGMRVIRYAIAIDLYPMNASPE